MYDLLVYHWAWNTVTVTFTMYGKMGRLLAEDIVVRLNLWLRKDDEYHGYCKLCSCQVKYSTQGAQAFTQHSQRKKNKEFSDIKFSASQMHISGKAES